MPIKDLILDAVLYDPYKGDADATLPDLQITANMAARGATTIQLAEEFNKRFPERTLSAVHQARTKRPGIVDRIAHLKESPLTPIPVFLNAWDGTGIQVEGEFHDELEPVDLGHHQIGNHQINIASPENQQKVLIAALLEDSAREEFDLTTTVGWSP